MLNDIMTNIDKRNQSNSPPNLSVAMAMGIEI